MSKKSQGFTLVELMVTVLIVGIIGAIAVPNYQRYVIRNNRAAVQVEMTQISNLMEQYRTRQFSYTGATFQSIGLSTSSATTLPFPSTGTANYTLGLTAAANGWTVTATPINKQVRDGMLALDNLGRKCWNPASASVCDLSDSSLAWTVSN